MKKMEKAQLFRPKKKKRAQFSTWKMISMNSEVMTFQANMNTKGLIFQNNGAVNIGPIQEERNLISIL